MYVVYKIVLFKKLQVPLHVYLNTISFCFATTTSCFQRRSICLCDMKNVGCVSALNYVQCKMSYIMHSAHVSLPFPRLKCTRSLILLIQKYMICEESIARIKYVMLMLID